MKRIKIFSMLLVGAIPVALTCALYSETPGVIRSWYLLGPFEKAGLETEIVKDEAGLVLSENTVIAGKKVKRHNSLDDIINLEDTEVFGYLDNAACFASFELTTKEERMAKLYLGSDDGIKVYVNKENVLANDIPRGTVPDEDILNIFLKKGKNSILLKISDFSGGWSFTCRLTDMEGKEIKDISYSPEPFNLSRLYPVEVTASSVQDNDMKGFGPLFMFDGKPDTRWSSAHSDNQWLVLDFGEPVKISRLGMVWENAMSDTEEIFLSADKKKWESAFKISGARNSRRNLRLPGQKAARFLKWQGIKRATDWGYSIWEFSIFGSGKAGSPEKIKVSVENEKEKIVKKEEKKEEKNISIKEYPKKVKAGEKAKIVIGWQEAPPQDKYNIIVQLENWQVKPGICHFQKVEKFGTKEKMTVEINIPANTGKASGCRFVAAFISKTKDWSDSPSMTATPADVVIE